MTLRGCTLLLMGGLSLSKTVVNVMTFAKVALAAWRGRESRRPFSILSPQMFLPVQLKMFNIVQLNGLSIF